MTWVAEKYARVLWGMKMPIEVLDEAMKIYDSEPLLRKMLEDPTVYRESKERIAGKVFPAQIQNVIKMLCAYADMEYFPEIVECYRIYANEHNHIVNAKLRYTTAPNEEQIASFKEFLIREFDAQDVDFQMEKDTSLLGGFVLEAEGKSYDWSVKGRFSALQRQLK